jgi:hypothetical protein
LTADGEVDVGGVAGQQYTAAGSVLAGDAFEEPFQVALCAADDGFALHRGTGDGQTGQSGEVEGLGTFLAE